MEISNLKSKLLRLLPFYRWHPEVAIRYLPIADQIKLISHHEPVLDVGSGGLGIAPYLGENISGLDTSFQPPIHPLIHPKIGSGEKIPFGDRSFSVVVSVDTLEHVPPQKREIILREMIRVAKTTVIIAVPTGLKSQSQDRNLAVYYQRKFGREFPFFLEHEKYSLPSEKDLEKLVTAALAKNHRTARVSFKGNENLNLRIFLMKGWITTNTLENIFQRKILLLALPAFKLFDKPPYYRTIATIKLN